MSSNDEIYFAAKDRFDMLTVDCYKFSIIVENGILSFVLSFVVD